MFQILILKLSAFYSVIPYFICYYNEQCQQKNNKQQHAQKILNLFRFFTLPGAGVNNGCIIKIKPVPDFFPVYTNKKVDCFHNKNNKQDKRKGCRNKWYIFHIELFGKP